MMEIEIPDPCLVVLLGTAGSGKTTFAHAHFAEEEVVSSDGCRKILSQSEEFRESTLGDVFALFRQMILHRLAERKTVLADATGTLRISRVPLLAAARIAGVPAVCITFDVPLEVAADRDRHRSRTVGDYVLRRQQREVAAARRVVPWEGYAAIHAIRAEDQSRVRIVRSPRPAPAPKPFLEGTALETQVLPRAEMQRLLPGWAASPYPFLFRALPPGNDVRLEFERGRPDPDPYREGIRTELTNGGIWGRKATQELTLLCRESEAGVLTAVAPVLPEPQRDASHHDFFWEFTEMDSMSMEFAPPPTYLGGGGEANGAEAFLNSFPEHACIQAVRVVPTPTAATP